MNTQLLKHRIFNDFLFRIESCREAIVIALHVPRVLSILWLIIVEIIMGSNPF